MVKLGRLRTNDAKMPVVVQNSEFRVYYEDTDSGGVVYHSNYLKFMERARTEWLVQCGYMPWSTSERFGIIFAVKSAEMDFSKPAFLGDILNVTVEDVFVRGASLYLLQRVVRNDEDLVFGKFRIACVDSQNFTVKRMPADLRNRLIKWKM